MSVQLNDGRHQTHETDSAITSFAPDNPGIVQTVTSAFKGEDEPMAKSHPKAPFAIVFLTYPLVLISSLIIMAVAFWLFGGFGGGDQTVQ